jgi:nucleoside-diphosphate-sugar epimerase
MNVLITGGTGFLGRRTASVLRELGHTVAVIGRDRQIGQELETAGISFCQADLRNLNDLEKAFVNTVDVVVHAAAFSSPWGRKTIFEQVNIVGTDNMLKLAQKYKIKRFIYISTSSVYFDFNDRFNIKELDAVAKRAPSEYTRTKLIAEKGVLSAQNAGLATIILRPRGIFGPNDSSIMPRLIRAYKLGRLPIIGTGENVVDVTYIDNVVESIRCSIVAENDACGEIYNITNGEPVNLWDFIEKLFHKLGYQLTRRHISYRLLYPICLINELACKYLLLGKKEPRLTRYTMALLAKSQTLDISKAQQQLNYRPIVSLAEGLERTVEWYKQKELS